METLTALGGDGNSPGEYGLCGKRLKLTFPAVLGQIRATRENGEPSEEAKEKNTSPKVPVAKKILINKLGAVISEKERPHSEKMIPRQQDNFVLSHLYKHTLSRSKLHQHRLYQFWKG